MSAWSPDSSRIAFTSWRRGRHVHPDIYVMNADGSSQRRLTRNPADDADPGLVARRAQHRLYSNRDGDFNVYVMNADGSRQRKLTRN